MRQKSKADPVSDSANLARVKPIEVTGDDGHRHRERQNAGYSTRGADQLARIANGHLVAVADRCHGNDGPPERVRDALDLRADDAEFGVVDNARVDEHADQQDDEKQAELFTAGTHGHYEHLQTD